MNKNTREEQQGKNNKGQEENIYKKKNNKQKDSPCHTNNRKTGTREE